MKIMFDGVQIVKAFCHLGNKDLRIVVGKETFTQKEELYWEKTVTAFWKKNIGQNTDLANDTRMLRKEDSNTECLRKKPAAEKSWFLKKNP